MGDWPSSTPISPCGWLMCHQFQERHLLLTKLIYSDFLCVWMWTLGMQIGDKWE